jgi:prepilin-type N-terminal cleavage/methylation domain-containing protein
MRASPPRGYSLIEVIFVLAIVSTLIGATMMQLHASVDDYRAAGAARFLATRVQQTRMEAIARSTNVALQITLTTVGFSYATYVDGNRDGVLTRDIRRGVDWRLGEARRLSDDFPGVDFGVLPDLPPVESGAAAPGSDPIKLGSSDLLSFSSLGTSSSGSLYIRGNGVQYVVRVLGETGRTRVLVYVPGTRTWKLL